MEESDAYDWLDKLEERLSAPVPRPSEPHAAPESVPEHEPEIAAAAAPAVSSGAMPAGSEWWKGSPDSQPSRHVSKDLVNKLERLSEEREQTLEELESLKIENASLKEKQQVVLSQLADLRLKALAAIEGYEAKLRSLEEQKLFFERQVADQKQITDKLMDTVRTVKGKS